MGSSLTSRVLMASAGTGKTYRLGIEYILRLIYESRQLDLNVDRNIDCYKSIIAITFTRKATAEIRQKIFEHLNDIIKGDEELIKNLNKILDDNKMSPLTDLDKKNLGEIYKNMCANKHKIYVKTIDGFINTVFERCVAPIKNIPTLETVNVHNDKIYYDVLSEIFKNKELLKLFRDIYFSDSNTLLEGRSVDSCLNIVKSIIGNSFLFLFCKKDMSKINNQDENVLSDEVQSVYNELIDKFDELFRYKMEKKPNYYIKAVYAQKNVFETFDELIQYLRQFFGSRDNIVQNANTILDDPFFLKEVVASKTKQGFSKDEQTEFIMRIKNAVLKYIFYRKGGIVDNHNKYLKFYAGVIDIYQKIIYEKKEFDFNDISIEIYKSFYNSDNYCRDGKVTAAFFDAMNVEFRHCLIDEAQDTSVLQWAILSPILSAIQDWTIVGDQKQAIYSWRGGEMNLLGKITDIFPQAKQEVMGTSYRSYKKVIEHVNKIFTGFDSEDFDDNRWRYETVNTVKDKEGSAHFYFDEYKEKLSKDDKKAEIEYKNKTEEDSIQYFINDVVIKSINDNNIPLKDCAIIARKNSTLVYMAELLKANSVDYYLDSSKSFFTHKAVDAIMFLLKFIVTDDYVYFFEFVKTQMINIGLEDYQNLLREYKLKKYFDFADSKFDFMKDIDIIIKKKHSYNGVYALIKDIYTIFGVNNIFVQDIDSKNLYKLLEIALTFDNGAVDYNKSLNGFLLYCEDNAESFKLERSSSVNAINLITAHKSKGLEYKNVFVYNNVDSRDGSSLNAPQVSFLSKYNEDFTSVSNILFVKKTDKTAIGKCDGAIGDDLIDFCIQADKDEKLNDFFEELNTVYVALTRPKHNLVVYTTSVNNYIGKEKNLNKSYIGNSIFQSYVKQMVGFIDRMETPKNLSFPLECHDGTFYVEEDEKNVDDNSNAKEKLKRMLCYFDFDVNQTAIKNSESKQSLTSFFDKKCQNYHERKRLTGVAVHDYLSKIKYGTPSELEFAKRYLFTKYGNIFNREQFSNIFSKVDSFVCASENADIYNEKWTRILNEYSLYDESRGQIKRLDRLMIDDVGKNILIVDYKTGDVDEEQLQGYQDLIGRLGLSQQSGWTINRRFAEIEI